MKYLDKILQIMHVHMWIPHANLVKEGSFLHNCDIGQGSVNYPFTSVVILIE